MKKFTKVLLASSMLVGLAACGKTDPAPVTVTWRTTVQNFLTENGIKDAELPDLSDDCFKNIKITASKEHDEYGDYVVVVLDTEKPSEIGWSALSDVVNADGWVEVDEDTEDYVEGGTSGYYSLTCRSNFNEDGLYATASIYVAEEDCPYLDPDEGDTPYCEIWYEILDDSVSAAEATELIDGLTEFYGEEESLIKESADLASVSPYWTVEAEYQDMSGVVCEQIAANYGGTYDEFYSMILECSFYEMDVHGETAEAAIKDLFNHIKNESSYGLKIDEEVTYDEEDDSYYALFVDQNESLCVQLSSYEFFGSITVELMGYAITEEAFQLSSIELHANDFSAPFNENSELCDAMLDVVNDSDYDLDSSIAKEWFYELTGTIDKNNQAVVATFNNQIFDFTFKVGYMGARTEFPETEINALFADFTTEIPTLDGKFEVERIEDENFGSVIAVIGYDNVPSSSPDSFGSKLLKQFKEASKDWEINELVDEDGTTYLINSVERKNNKQIRVELLFFDVIPEERGWGVTKPVMEVFFYAVPAPSTFNVEHIKEYYNELGIVLDDVPALDGEIFYEAFDDDGTLVFYANKTGLPEVFAAKLEESSSWENVESRVVSGPDGEDVTIYTANSVARSEPDVYGMKNAAYFYFYELDGYFNLFFDVVPVERNTVNTINIASINTALSQVGNPVQFNAEALESVAEFTYLVSEPDEYGGTVFTFYTTTAGANALLNAIVDKSILYAMSLDEYGSMLIFTEDQAFYMAIEAVDSDLWFITLFADPAE